MKAYSPFIVLNVALILACGCTAKGPSASRGVANAAEATAPVFNLPLRTELGEHFIAAEQSATNRLFELFKNHMVSNYSDGRQHAYRAVHAKGHGCVKATFEVKDSIDTQLKYGIFETPHTYDAFIRFSNGDGPPEDDAKLESRGMAIKIVGVDKAKILNEDDPYHAQDFLMADQPAFFLRDVVGYARAIEAREGNIFTKLIFAAKYRKELAYRDSATPISNPLNAQYWSKTPYQLGPGEAVKFTARPCVTTPMLSPPKKQKNYLKKAMAGQIGSEDTCFDFMLQRRTHRADRDLVMPIEDASVIWSEEISPFIKVAEIRIAKNQDIDSLNSVKFCENLSFNPWHAVVEERPLGNLNRVRKLVYEVSSRYRHEHNQASGQ